MDLSRLKLMADLASRAGKAFELYDILSVKKFSELSPDDVRAAMGAVLGKDPTNSQLSVPMLLLGHMDPDETVGAFVQNGGLQQFIQTLMGNGQGGPAGAPRELIHRCTFCDQLQVVQI